MKIRDEIFEQFNIVRERIAQGIHDNDWSAVGWNVALIAAVIMAVVALAVGVLALVWRILGTLLGKIFSVPLSAGAHIGKLLPNGSDFPVRGHFSPAGRPCGCWRDYTPVY